MGTRVRISDISPAGVRIQGLLLLDRLNKRMNEGANNEIVFLDPPAFELTVFGTQQGAEAQGSVRTRYRQPCSRCLKEIDNELSRDLRFVLKPKSSIPEGVKPEDDVFVIYFEGEYIDFEDTLQEVLILGLSPYLLPEREPDGSCALCGLKVQSEFSFGPQGGESKATLGPLLQKAGVKKQ